MCGSDRCLIICVGTLITAGLALMLTGNERGGEIALFAAVFVAIWAACRIILGKLGSHDDRMNDVAAGAQRLIRDVEGLMRDSLSLELDQTGMLHRALVGNGSGPQRIHHRH